MARLLDKMRPWWALAGLGLIGLALGALVHGWAGAAIGLLIGLMVDRVRLLWPYADRRWPAPRASLATRRFHIVVFAALGHVAKADGRVSEREVAAARAIMGELRLDETGRRAAVELFTHGKRPEAPLRTLLGRFRRVCRRVDQRERVLVYCLRIAQADGQPGEAQLRVLKRIGRALALEPGRFSRLFAQERARRGAPPPQALRRTLRSAYSLLGVSDTASDEEIKRAYRRAISRNHPDRVVAQGMDEGAVQAAARRTHAIRAAFEEIRRARNW